MTVAMKPAGRNSARPSEPTLGARDRRTLGELYDHFGAVAYSLAFSITADREHAERAVTRSFATTWNEYENGDLTAQEFFAALMRAVRSNAWSGRDGQRARATVPGFQSSPTGSGSMERAVALALNELPDAQRNVLALAYFGGLAVGEIAAELRAPMSYVKENLQAAMRHLRAVLTQRPNVLVRS